MRNIWRALGGRGYLLSPWPWRAVGYLVSGAVCGAVVLVVIVSGVVVGAALSVVVVGLPLLLLTALVGIPVAGVERWRLRIAGQEVAAGQHRVPAVPGLRAWLSTRLKEAATWRELAYAVLFGLVLWPLDALAVVLLAGVPLSMACTPLVVAVDGEAKVVKLWMVETWPGAFGVAVLGLALLAPGAYALGCAAGARAELARALLTTKAEDSERVTELVRSRVRLVDAFEAERRRIERDLHDGAQQRLVALTMTLGLARLDAPPGPLADQLAKAHADADGALAELRELIHGIHPKVLADYGLEAALTDAADRSPVPVDLDLDLPGRLPRPVETAAYFVAREALANVARHSGAETAGIHGRYDGGRLVLRIEDDGCGGADMSQGTGLTGLADRVSVLDGRLSLSSPPGGPTLLRMEIPCRPSRPAREPSA
ncbi:sensor histidine kinase [Streptomyces sp. NBC_00457]|uniref:sensor histidine kinase n=1 Tax=Streptomyces sp. NBC_00457 TaxID=2975748 RepID=UPI002E23714D